MPVSSAANAVPVQQQTRHWLCQPPINAEGMVVSKIRLCILQAPHTVLELQNLNANAAIHKESAAVACDAGFVNTGSTAKGRLITQPSRADKGPGTYLCLKVLAVEQDDLVSRENSQLQLVPCCCVRCSC